MKSICIGFCICFFFGCGSAVQPVVCSAQAYPDEGFATNAAAEIELQDRFEAIANKMDEATTAHPTANELEALFAEGTPSLKSITLPAAYSHLTDLFAGVELAASNVWQPVDPPSGHGGVYGRFLFSERGVDLGETVEKVIFSTSHYARAVSLMTDTAAVADVDRMLALFGTTPAFPMGDSGEVVTKDKFAAKYAKRRTDPSATIPGPYLAIKSAFINARVAVAGGDACVTERAAAFSDIRAQWERTLLSTAINYLNAAALTLAKANLTETEKSSSLHMIGEGVGFLRGLRILPAQHRLITDAQLDQVLTTLGGSSLAGSEAFRFVTASETTVGRLTAAVEQIQTARKFSEDEVATFKSSF